MSEAVVGALGSALIQALRQLGAAGRPDEANRIAATAWSAVRHHEDHLANRLNGVMHHLARLEQIAAAERSIPMSQQSQQSERSVLDVRNEPPVRRHTLIFETFDALAPGASFELRNDHDPKPLYYQFAAEHPGTFSWEYVEQGPVVWRVLIGRTNVG